MNTADLRIALFSGNYNYVRDGANQALNRLVEYLLRQGAAVRVYSPKVENPAFEPAGDLVGLPNIPIPGRAEYRAPLALSPRVRADLKKFAPNVVHVASPDLASHRAVTWARKRKLPILASVHTRFETYPRYYNMAWLEPIIEKGLHRFYNRCNALVAPSPSMADVLREQGMSGDIGIWSRGVDREIFNSSRRDMAWRRSHGIADNEFAIGFLGRLVMEKGLDVFADAVRVLRERGIAHKILIIGEGPAREWFESHIAGGTFLGHQQGADLGRAVAGMDLLFNPSITETFGNVTLEAMACGQPVVAAHATGSDSLVQDHITGRLTTPGDAEAFAEAIARYIKDPQLRKEHGAAGEARSLEFSWDRINKTVADTYLRLVEANEPQG